MHWFALNRLLHHDVTLAGIAASVYDPCTSALAYFCPPNAHIKSALVVSTRSTSSSKQHMGSVVTVWQDGGTSLLEATARKQGESDGEQEGALSDGSLLASSTDQVTNALHEMGFLSDDYECLHVMCTVLCCMPTVAGPMTACWGQKAVTAQF